MAFIFDHLYYVENVVVEKGFHISPCSVGLQFYVVLRPIDNCEVDVGGDQCCLVDGDGEHCDVLNIVGGCNEYIREGTTKTLVLIAPILNPFQRKGYCSLYVDTKPASDHTNKREIVVIEFDTHVGDRNKSNTRACPGVDEDPLNDCKPVDCDSYYNSRKPYYHPKYKRCIEVPQCIKADLIYNPVSNVCEDESIAEDDIDFLKEKGSKVRKAKDILIIRNRHNYTEILDDGDVHGNPTENKITSLRNIAPKSDKIHFKMLVSKCLVAKNMPVVILSFVIAVQCCTIFALLYCVMRSCSCFKEKKVVRKFFNYRQDATVTTPLINTSNMDTETDYQFLSDSSKVDQKIKCYKACQKEASNARASMSDDILSKCLNRRDWKQTKSDTIPEGFETEERRDAKVIFEDELVKDVQTSTERREMSEMAVEANRSSEREIKCHSYTSQSPGLRTSSVDARYVTEQPRRATVSISTEKAAQACFSNDSIDEFLSERGMIYLAGENISKYTFSTNSSENKPSTASMSSKTSKNIVQKVLSMIHKRSKAPLSDPGGGREAKKDLDLELLHMSKATVYSSSNDSEYKVYRKKDSRTSL
ncbi:unnamed protein product [Leptosia nina]|uniref:Uncharacterized protein n=1 Tax=Leptosia nina TaxID=320188 RepID=A0AAV1JAF9_9NEOP